MLRYLLALIFGLAALVGGLRNCMHGMSGPTKISCADAEKQLAAGGDFSWVQLSDCQADLGEAAVTKLKIVEEARDARRAKGEAPGKSAISDVYIPLRSTGAADGAKALLIIKTSDQKLTDALELPEDSELSPDGALGALKNMSGELELWNNRREFEGVVRDSAGRDDGDLRAMLGDVTDEKAKVLVLGKQEPANWIVQFVIAAVLLGYVAYGIFGAKKRLATSPEVAEMEGGGTEMKEP